jgi:hypothetical protein
VTILLQKRSAVERRPVRRQLTYEYFAAQKAQESKESEAKMEQVMSDQHETATTSRSMITTTSRERKEVEDCVANQRHSSEATTRMVHDVAGAREAQR